MPLIGCCVDSVLIVSPPCFLDFRRLCVQFHGKTRARVPTPPFRRLSGRWLDKIQGPVPGRLFRLLFCLLLVWSSFFSLCSQLPNHSPPMLEQNCYLSSSLSALKVMWASANNHTLKRELSRVVCLVIQVKDSRQKRITRFYLSLWLCRWVNCRFCRATCWWCP